jgi:hypothetical protein
MDSLESSTGVTPSPERGADSAPRNKESRLLSSADSAQNWLERREGEAEWSVLAGGLGLGRREGGARDRKMVEALLREAVGLRERQESHLTGARRPNLKPWLTGPAS